MIDDEDFSDHPPSISEIKSSKSGEARDATPRDILIEILRSIDRGEISPTEVVLCYRLPSEEGSTVVRYRCSSKDPCVSVGMVEIVKYTMLTEGKE